MTSTEEYGQDHFNALFADAEKDQKKELFRTFLRSYLKWYRVGQKSLKKKLDFTEVKEIIIVANSGILNAKEANKRVRARKLGHVLGYYLAVFRHGLASERLFLDPDEKEEILEIICIGVRRLEELGIKIKSRFIDRFARKIIEERAGKLSVEQKNFLTEAAASFQIVIKK